MFIYVMYLFDIKTKLGLRRMNWLDVFVLHYDNYCEEAMERFNFICDNAIIAYCRCSSILYVPKDQIVSHSCTITSLGKAYINKFQINSIVQSLQSYSAFFHEILFWPSFLVNFKVKTYILGISKYFFS